MPIAVIPVADKTIREETRNLAGLTALERFPCAPILVRQDEEYETGATNGNLMAMRL